MFWDREVTYAEKEKWFRCFPIDEEGRPTTKKAHWLIRVLFSEHNKTFSVEELSRSYLYEPPELVESVCRSLEMIEIIKSNPKGSKNYQYYLNSPNFELQAKVEVALLDCNWLANLPYSPTNPCRT